MATCPTCPRHLERTYPAKQCPRCLFDALMDLADVMSRAYVECRRFDLAERMFTDIATSADLALLEDRPTLIRLAGRTPALP